MMSQSLARALHTKERAPTYKLLDVDGNEVKLPAHGSEFKTLTGFWSALKWKEGDVLRGANWGTSLDTINEFNVVRIKTGKVELTFVKGVDRLYVRK